MSRGLRERMTAPVKSHADTKVAQPLRVENDGHQHAVPGDFPKQSDQEKMDPATEDETELVFEDDTLHHVTEDQTPAGEPRADADVDVERGDNTVERESAKEPEPCPLGWSTPSEIAGSLAFIVGLLLMLALVVALSAGFCYVFWMWGAKILGYLFGIPVGFVVWGASFPLVALWWVFWRWVGMAVEVPADFTPSPIWYWHLLFG